MHQWPVLIWRPFLAISLTNGNRHPLKTTQAPDTSRLPQLPHTAILIKAHLKQQNETKKKGPPQYLLSHTFNANSTTRRPVRFSCRKGFRPEKERSGKKNKILQARSIVLCGDLLYVLFLDLLPGGYERVFLKIYWGSTDFGNIV